MERWKEGRKDTPMKDIKDGWMVAKKERKKERQEGQMD